jgi:hypothetical protein
MTVDVEKVSPIPITCSKKGKKKAKETWEGNQPNTIIVFTEASMLKPVKMKRKAMQIQALKKPVSYLPL